MSARTLPAEYRLARDVKPGWEVLCDNDEWVKVQGWFRYDSPTNPSVVVLRFVDGSEARSWANDELMTRKVRYPVLVGEGT